jgi:hypothetical protein
MFFGFDDAYLQTLALILGEQGARTFDAAFDIARVSPSSTQASSCL